MIVVPDVPACVRRMPRCVAGSARDFAMMCAAALLSSQSAAVCAAACACACTPVRCGPRVNFTRILCVVLCVHAVSALSSVHVYVQHAPCVSVCQLCCSPATGTQAGAERVLCYVVLTGRAVCVALAHLRRELLELRAAVWRCFSIILPPLRGGVVRLVGPAEKFVLFVRPPCLVLCGGVVASAQLCAQRSRITGHQAHATWLLAHASPACTRAAFPMLLPRRCIVGLPVLASRFVVCQQSRMLRVVCLPPAR